MRRILLIAVPLALALAACSGEDTGEETEAAAEDSPEDQVYEVAEEFAASLYNVDGDSGCALLDESTKEQVASGQDAEDCVTAYPDYVESLPAPDEVEVGEIDLGTDLDGDADIATVELVFADDAQEGALELRQEQQGQWIATRVPGITLGGA